MKKRAAFLDKDGTLIPDIPYNTNPANILISDDVIEGLKLLAAEDFQLIVVSNQPGIAMGIIREEELTIVKNRIEELLKVHSISLSAFYFCPHDEMTNCSCRKPMPGLLFRAAQEKEISLENSWMIGDILNDIEAGNRAGCKTILIDNGNETEWEKGDYRAPGFIARNMKEAAEFILNEIPWR